LGIGPNPQFESKNFIEKYIKIYLNLK